MTFVCLVDAPKNHRSATAQWKEKNSKTISDKDFISARLVGGMGLTIERWVRLRIIIFSSSDVGVYIGHCCFSLRQLVSPDWLHLTSVRLFVRAR